MKAHQPLGIRMSCPQPGMRLCTVRQRPAHASHVHGDRHLGPCAKVGHHGQPAGASVAADVVVAAAQWCTRLALDDVAVLMGQGRHPHAGVQVGVVLAGLLVLQFRAKIQAFLPANATEVENAGSKRTCNIAVQHAIVATP